MLSMLRYMADCRDSRATTLIWRNRRPKNMIYLNKFEDLEAKLTGLHRIHIFESGEFLNIGLNHAFCLSSQMVMSIFAFIYATLGFTQAYPGNAWPQAGHSTLRAATDNERLRSDLIAIGFPSRTIFTEALGI